MLKRLCFVVFLLVTCSAHALEYTDVYYDVAEQGWGVFLVQSNTFQFLAFFIYGADSKPTWYTAQLSDNGAGAYTGPLYLTTGTFFSAPWQGYNANPVGTATFSPIDIYHATLTYTINGIGTVTKSIQRQTLASYAMAGNYSGSMSGSISGCSDPAGNDPAFRGRYGLVASQAGDASATLMFTFVDTVHTGIVCTVSGPLIHMGRLYQMAGALACTGPAQDGVARPATVDSLHPTGQGIEGRMTATTSGGCAASFHFAAVLNVNN